MVVLTRRQKHAARLRDMSKHAIQSCGKSSEYESMAYLSVL